MPTRDLPDECCIGLAVRKPGCDTEQASATSPAASTND
jgi:hypothetical protein